MLSVTLFLFMQFFCFDLPTKIQNNLQERVSLKYNHAIVAAYVREGKPTFFSAGDFPLDIKSEEAIFEIGSITKLFTAHLTLILTQDGLLDLDLPIEEYLPVSIPSFSNSKITLRHLLTHTSGLKDPENKNYYNPKNGNTVPVADWTKEDLYTFLEAFKLEKDPGTSILYSNLAYALVGSILESVTQKSYETILNEKILGPIKLNSTFLSFSETSKKRGVQGFINGEKALPWEIPNLPAFGGLKSTAKDLSTYLQYIFCREEVSIPILNTLILPYFENKDNQMAVSIGFGIDRRFENELYVASGTSLGFSCMMLFSPKKKEGVVLLTDSNSLDALAYHWLDPRFTTETLYREIFCSKTELIPFEGTYYDTEDTTSWVQIRAMEGYLEIFQKDDPPVKFIPMGEKQFFTRFFGSATQPIKFEEESNCRLIVKIGGKKTIFLRSI